MLPPAGLRDIERWKLGKEKPRARYQTNGLMSVRPCGEREFVLAFLESSRRPFASQMRHVMTWGIFWIYWKPTWRGERFDFFLKKMQTAIGAEKWREKNC